MICGREVEIETRGKSYDLVVGRIRVGGLYTREAMVWVGAAWDYPQYDPDPVIPGPEANARAGRLGLWPAARPIAL